MDTALVILVFLITFGNKSRILLICRIVSFHPFDLFGLPSLALVRSTSGESLRLWISRHLSCSGCTLGAQQSALSPQLPRHAAGAGRRLEADLPPRGQNLSGRCAAFDLLSWILGPGSF